MGATMSSAVRTRHWPALVVLIVGLALTIALASAARVVYDRDEDASLEQRALAVSTVLTAAVPAIELPLAAAALLAEETDGDPQAFERALGSRVGQGPLPFVGASLWRSGSAEPIVSIGLPAALALRAPEEITDVIDRALEDPGLTVIDLLDEDPPRLAYATSASVSERSYVVYAAQTLPEDRTAVRPDAAAFSELDYAVYLGDDEHARALLFSSTPDLPLTGRRAEIDAPFGDSNLHVVLTPREALTGTWEKRSWWLIGVALLALTVGAVALTERLLRSRARAEQLSQENARLFAEQRTVAQTLQHSMLPDALPAAEGVQFAVRYLPGAEALEVGGDWYDVMPLDDGRMCFVVGDVSGRGLEAATVMASLRYAIRAFASQGDDPASIVEKAGRLVSVGRDGRYATVLCALLDPRTGEVTFANAGHPDPLLVSGGQTETVLTPTGVPLGVRTDTSYTAVTIALRPGATLLVFTDGLVERKGELFDVGVDRLRAVVESHQGSLDDLLSHVMQELLPAGTDDDAAILGLRWQT